jgi:hypothetical protein
MLSVVILNDIMMSVAAYVVLGTFEIIHGWKIVITKEAKWYKENQKWNSINLKIEILNMELQVFA